MRVWPREHVLVRHSRVWIYRTPYSYPAITAQMSTLCLLVNVKQVSPERVSAKITSVLYNCPSCYSLNAAPFEVNMTAAYRGTTTSHVSKVIHLQTQLKAHFFLIHPKILQTEVIFKRPCHPCCVTIAAFYFLGYILCRVFIMYDIYISPLILEHSCFPLLVKNA